MKTMRTIASIEIQPVYKYPSDTGSLTITDAYVTVLELINKARKMKDGEMMCDELLKLKSILSQL